MFKELRPFTQLQGTQISCAVCKMASGRAGEGLDKDEAEQGATRGSTASGANSEVLIQQ